MARPKKTGLDYFPLDTSFDEKIQALESIYKNDGLVWIIKAWQTAYRNEFGEIDTTKYFGEILANNSRITPEKQMEILCFCLDVGLLITTDKPGVFSSRGIQKRISSVSKDRSSAIERYNAKKIQKKVKESKVKDFGDTSPKNPRSIDTADYTTWTKNYTLQPKVPHEEYIERFLWWIDNCKGKHLFDETLQKYPMANINAVIDSLGLHIQDKSKKRYESPFRTISKWLIMDHERKSKNAVS